MSKYILFLFSFFTLLSFSQTRKIPIDTMVVTTHNTTIKGMSVSYTATTGTQPVWNKSDKPIATLYYTYYERNDVKDRAHRP